MGLRDPTEVSPMFVVDTHDQGFGSTAFPIDRSAADTITGDRLDFTIDDVIRAEGARVPARDMCHWKAAFAIVHEDGSPPSAAEIARVDTYRRRWEEFYPDATDRRGSFDTTLAGTGLGTSECPSTEPPPPPPDAGVGQVDASMPDPQGDASVIDDASEPAPDAGVVGLPDAAATVHPMEQPRNDEPRVIIDDGCACNGAQSGRSSAWILVALGIAVSLLRRRR
jgi:MYXO-CTERM domain-containing protein